LKHGVETQKKVNSGAFAFARQRTSAAVT